MPSITAYSPYETLSVIQSVAKHGTDASAFHDISVALNQNEFISREDDNNKSERLSATSLRGFYDELVNAEKKASSVEVVSDGASGERSPKRRKLSASPSSSQSIGDQELLGVLIARLYSRFKDEALKEIRSDEESYAKLQSQINAMEIEIETARKTAKSTAPAATLHHAHQQTELGTSTDEVVRAATTSSGATAVHPAAREGKNLVLDAQIRTRPSPQTASSSAQPNLADQDSLTATKTPVSSRPASRAASAAPPTRSSQLGASQPSLGTVDKGQSQGPARRHNPAPLPSQSVLAPGAESPQVQTSPHRQQRPQLNQQGSGQGYASPMPPHGQHVYPPYPQYPHQWNPHMSPQPYQQHPGYPPMYYPPQGRPGPQTPQPMPYAQHPHSAPLHHVPSQGWPGQPHSPYAGPVANSPTSRPASASRSASSTPWKKTPQIISARRQASPKRPEREVSPLTDHDSPPPETSARDSAEGTPVKENPARNISVQPTRSSRRGRPLSVTPSATRPSRSPSDDSRLSDTVTGRANTARRVQKIKAEPPSTPAPVASDSEQQRSSSRRVRPRNGTLAPNLASSKRKRESASPSFSPDAPRSSSKMAHQIFRHDPGLVVVSRNFAKTAQLLLNDITSHKLAGIFAKPLSERDAPGYKDLILRPQDLKSIKAAVSKGSRAAQAAIDALESATVDEGKDKDAEATPRPSIVAGASASLGNGFFVVRSNPDLVPPKGIVNSSQLEMELVRMFANAVMFNPLPSGERGFGRSLRLREDGGRKEELSRHIPRSLLRALKKKASRNRRDDEATSQGSDEDGEEADDADDREGSSEEEDAEDDDNEKDSDQSEHSSDGTLSTLGGGQGWDEGGIISDTREMFDDVVVMVNKWRALEEERMGGTESNQGKGGTMTTTGSAYLAPSADVTGNAARQMSVSASSNLEVDDRENTPTAGPGTRKRRRVGEH